MLTIINTTSLRDEFDYKQLITFYNDRICAQDTLETIINEKKRSYPNCDEQNFSDKKIHIDIIFAFPRNFYFNFGIIFQNRASNRF